MNKFAHNPDGIKVPESRTSFDFHRLMGHSIRNLVNCPKFLTLARHADLEEVTPLHCIEADTLEKIDLQVPRQSLLTKIGFEGLRYTILRVAVESKEEYLLVVCERNRQGLLLPLNLLDELGDTAAHVAAR